MKLVKPTLWESMRRYARQVHDTDGAIDEHVQTHWIVILPRADSPIISYYVWYPFIFTIHFVWRDMFSKKITIRVQHNRLFTFNFYFWLLLSRAAAQIKHTLHNAFQCTRQIYIFSNLDWKLFIDHHLIYIAENVFFLFVWIFIYAIIICTNYVFFFLR